MASFRAEFRPISRLPFPLEAQSNPFVVGLRMGGRPAPPSRLPIRMAFFGHKTKQRFNTPINLFFDT